MSCVDKGLYQVTAHKGPFVGEGRQDQESSSKRTRETKDSPPNSNVTRCVVPKKEEETQDVNDVQEQNGGEETPTQNGHSSENGEPQKNGVAKTLEQTEEGECLLENHEYTHFGQ